MLCFRRAGDQLINLCAFYGSCCPVVGTRLGAMVLFCRWTGFHLSPCRHCVFVVIFGRKCVVSKRPPCPQHSSCWSTVSYSVNSFPDLLYPLTAQVACSSLLSPRSNPRLGYSVFCISTPEGLGYALTCQQVFIMKARPKIAPKVLRSC